MDIYSVYIMDVYIYIHTYVYINMCTYVMDIWWVHDGYDGSMMNIWCNDFYWYKSIIIILYSIYILYEWYYLSILLNSNDN